MNALRAEAFNVLLCLVLGVALGGLMALVRHRDPARGKHVESFVAEPQIILSEVPGV